MKTGLLELLLSLPSAGSDGDKAAYKIQPIQPPAVAAPTRSDVYSKSEPSVQDEVRRLVKRIIKLLGFEGPGSSGNGP
jgi:hypothetical protein